MASWLGGGGREEEEEEGEYSYRVEYLVGVELSSGLLWLLASMYRKECCLEDETITKAWGQGGQYEIDRVPSYVVGYGVRG